MGMTVTVNGEAREVPDTTTVRDLIERLGLGNAACAAEVNREVVPKRRHAEHTWHQGDVVELVSLVGGG